MNQFPLQSGQTYLFIGDSITDCGRRDSQAPYGNGYARMCIDLIAARYPDRHIRFLNKGISGNTVEDLANRWQDDMLAHQPDWLSIKIGINDLHRTLRKEPTAVPPEKFAPLYRSLLERTRAATKARLILIDPFYISDDTDSGSWRSQVLQALPAYLDTVERLAKEFDALHVRTHAAFQQQLRHRPADSLAPEPVHPNPTGHLVIAHELLKVLGW
jgi:lysophospholipase L1-like esterase